MRILTILTLILIDELISGPLSNRDIYSDHTPERGSKNVAVLVAVAVAVAVAVENKKQQNRDRE